uniref:Uncharacterized protein n=1 Tax=Iconisemion striatum TaxID=60296 RepID=A0A1A7XAZ1_9TELE
MAVNMDSESSSLDEEKSRETSTKTSQNVRKLCYMHTASGKHEEERDFTFTRWNTYREAITKWLGLHGESRALAELYQHCRDIKFDNVPEDAAFHPTCYIRFIDKRRMEQAEKRIAREKTKAENTEEHVEVLQGLRTFTSMLQGEPSCTKEIPMKKFRSRPGLSIPFSGPVLPAVCIICKKAEKYITVHAKRQKAHLVQAQTSSAGRLQKAAEIKQDDSILLHIKDKDCVSLGVRYHKCCYKQYTVFLSRPTTTDRRQ